MSGPPRWPGTVLRAGAIAGATLWAYGPALRGGWVWDDDVEILQNRVLRDPRGWWTPWVHPAGQDYFPLKSTLQWIQWRLWGPEPLGYHLTSVALHLLSAWLLWRLLLRLGIRQGWIGGLLFALHPLAAESVAWIAEFKNALSLPLLLAAMLAWLRFERTRRAGPYAASLGLFLLALLAKSTVVMLPCVLLLHAWWRRGRAGPGDWLRAAPFFAAALALGAVTLEFQAHRAIGPVAVVTAGAGERLAGAGLSLLFYLGKVLWPARLMPIYPHWTDRQLWFGLAGWLALGAGAAALLRRGGAAGRAALLGLGFFALNLLPVLGIVPIAFDRLSWVADHFGYVSLVGIAGLAAAAADLAWRRRPALAAAGTAALALALAASTRAQAASFRDAEALWSRAVRLNPAAPLARNNLGIALADRGRYPEAIAQYQASLRLDPGSAEVRTNLANSLAESGRGAEAEAQYRAALRLDPKFWGASFNLGKLLARSGHPEGALAEYARAMRLNPDYAPGAYEFGNALAQAGRTAEAEEWYRRALHADPDLADARLNYGNLLAEQGRASDAIAQYEVVLRLEPDSADVHNNLGSLLAMSGRLAEARAQFQQALRLKPDYAEARANLRRIDLMEGHGR
ncbi:MAG TPA: tetratricopeptide repeat protein [Opitutaceae bacterium]|nr:tetratricopeptide repeat protein [Opitutaceae bacterium]